MNHANGYPKTMVHPAHRKGTFQPISGTESYRSDGSVKTVDYQGTPDRFPPVEVNNSDQEAQHRAQGYLAYGETAVQTQGHQEYPLMMTHPGYEPAVEAIVETRNGAGQITIPGVPGRPAKHPSITVSTKADEEQAATRGYQRPGKSDADAMQKAISSPHVPGRIASEYPKMVDGKLVQDPALNASGVKEYPKWITLNGHPHGGLVVNSAAEEEQLLGKKPVDDRAAKRVAALKRKAEAEAALAAAQAELGDEDEDEDRPALTINTMPATVAAVVENQKTDRDTLRAQAQALGIEVSKTWNAKTIAKKIAEHQGA